MINKFQEKVTRIVERAIHTHYFFNVLHFLHAVLHPCIIGLNPMLTLTINSNFTNIFKDIPALPTGQIHQNIQNGW